MPGCLLFILAIAPLLTSGIIALHHSQSPLAILFVLLGAIAGIILVPLSGIFWLQVFHRSFMESPAGGFILIPVILPFFAYSGSVAGTWLIATFYGYSLLAVFQAVAFGFTVVLSGLIPPAIAVIRYPATISVASSEFVIVLFAICSGIASSWLGSKLAYGLVIGLSDYAMH
ncbi:hypothetical protein IQ243_23615 [Nostocales cyanobacterium LEGE 11386]|nr:hypothetical protein [Nostocales cyanobacterium LEGE 11386]